MYNSYLGYGSRGSNDHENNTEFILFE